MALKRPPEHRADAPIVFVHPLDDAWDNDRVREEQEAMEAAGEDPTSHPVAMYHGGFTRFDITANVQFLDKSAAPQDYLDESKRPEKWHLKRLGFQEWYQVQPAWERAVAAGERPWEAYTKACRIGIKRVDRKSTRLNSSHSSVSRMPSSA